MDRTATQAPKLPKLGRDQVDNAIVDGIEVTQGEARQWIEANIGPIHSNVPRNFVSHSRGEKVVQLKALPPEEWRLL